MATTPESICQARFEYGTPRSAPYREGFLTGVRRAAAKRSGVGENPYVWGTAHADAWASGAEEGKAHYEQLQHTTTNHFKGQHA